MTIMGTMRRWFGAAEPIPSPFACISAQEFGAEVVEVVTATADVDLQPFCSTEEARPYLHQPFTFGDSTYATNGAILIRVDARPDVMVIEPEQPTRDSVETLFALRFGGDFGPLPEYKTITGRTMEMDCVTCEGGGFVKDCPDCESDGDEGSIGCGTCDEYGFVTAGKDDDGARSCHACDDTRRETVDLADAARFPNLDIDITYLRLIEALPGLEVAFPDKDTEPMSFCFDGGWGLIMPLRRTAAEVAPSVA